ncbi:MAG: protein kinase [Gemmataceae bacterium]
MTRWFYAKDRQKHGPVAWGDLLALFASGGLSATDMVLEEGTSKWRPAGEITSHAAHLATTATPLSAQSVELVDQANELPETVDDVKSAVSANSIGEDLATCVTLTPPPQPSFQDPACPQIPGYEILAKLGEGGMGCVYKARHLQLNRVVALKMIRDKYRSSDNSFQQFQKEAEAVATFQHPNIVQIHEIGAHDDRPYFTLEYVNRGNLHEQLKGVPQEPHEAAQLVATIARAMHYAHQRRIIHRDLKPMNVLLASPLAAAEGSPASGVTRFGVPKVADFGLAKLLSEGAAHAETQEIRGTPQYMAPEQVSHKVKLIGPATDVYALGAILYEMLTGRPPFQGKDLLDTLDLVRTQEPVPPSQLQPKTPRDLETICLKCLQKEPAKRYVSAESLAEDLQRFLDDEPIMARPVGRLERGWRWARKEPKLAASLVLAASLLVAVAVVMAVSAQLQKENARKQATLRQAADAQAERADREAETARRNEIEARENELKADREKQSAQDNERLAFRHLYAANMSLAQRSWELGDGGNLEEHLRRTMPENTGGVDLRGFEWYYWRRLLDVPVTLNGHASHVTSVAFSPDGKRIASASTDTTIKVWDATTGRQINTLELGRQDYVFLVAFSLDGKWLGSWSKKAIKVWDLMAGRAH